MATDQDRETEPTDPSRREFLRKAIIIGGAAITSATAGALTIPFLASPEKQSTINSSAIEEKGIRGLYSDILNNPPNDPDRIAAEAVLTKRAVKAKIPEPTETALSVIFDSKKRITLFDKYIDIRKEMAGNYWSQSAEERDFLSKIKASGKGLEFCTDIYFEAKKTLQEKIAEVGGMRNFYETYRPDLLKPQNLSPDSLGKLLSGSSIEHLLPNPGAIYQTVLFATGDTGTDPKSGWVVSYPFAKSGEQSALTIIKNSSVSVQEKAYQELLLRQLCDKISLPNGLKYKPETVPGFLNGNIGLRSLEKTVMLVDYMDKNFKIKYNPFNPKSEVLVTYLSLIFGLEGETGWLNGQILNRGGVDEAENFRKKALAGFDKNPDLTDKVLGANKEYHRAVVLGGTFQRIYNFYNIPMDTTNR